MVLRPVFVRRPKDENPRHRRYDQWRTVEAPAPRLTQTCGACGDYLHHPPRRSIVYLFRLNCGFDNGKIKLAQFLVLSPFALRRSNFNNGCFLFSDEAAGSSPNRWPCARYPCASLILSPSAFVGWNPVMVALFRLNYGFGHGIVSLASLALSSFARRWSKSIKNGCFISIELLVWSRKDLTLLKSCPLIVRPSFARSLFAVGRAKYTTILTSVATSWNSPENSISWLCSVSFEVGKQIDQCLELARMNYTVSWKR